MKLQRTLNPRFGLLLLLPVVNVAAGLLMLLLLSGGFLLQPGIAVKVPDSPFLLSPQRDPLIASITGEPIPAIYFENQRMNALELGNRLAAIHGKTRTLLIKADHRAPIELLVQVVNAAVTHGFSVALATSDPS